jgi:hypothetical protein
LQAHPERHAEVDRLGHRGVVRERDAELLRARDPGDERDVVGDVVLRVQADEQRPGCLVEQAVAAAHARDHLELAAERTAQDRVADIDIELPFASKSRAVTAYGTWTSSSSVLP